MESSQKHWGLLLEKRNIPLKKVKQVFLGLDSTVNAGSSDRVYTIVTKISTEPMILVIMPCFVGLALLGLVGAGIKRWFHYRRLARMVELVDPEKLKPDKGYTIENPMVKSR